MGHLECRSDLWHGLGEWAHDDAEDLVHRHARGLAELTAAYFEPGRGALVLRGGEVGGLGARADPEFVVAHELVHAWQDQHLGIVELLRTGEPTIDELNVRHCLLEGEAQFAMYAVMAARKGGDLSRLRLEELRDHTAELIGADVAMAAYDHGARYVEARWHEGGWESVRTVWEAPPPSTEQLLHSEKLGVDEPQELDLPGWPEALDAAELLGSNQVGELQILASLRSAGASSPVARRAAAGWDGDRLDRYRTADGELALLWRTVWDREEDARQFYEALADVGDGEWRVDGHVVDWVRCVDGALAAPLLEALAAFPCEPRPGSRDAETAAVVDAALEAEQELEPFACDGRWVVPLADLSVPIPEGWEGRTFNGVPILAPDRGGISSGSLLVELQPDLGDDLDAAGAQLRADCERMQAEIAAVERLELDGREAVCVRIERLKGAAVDSRTVVLLGEERQLLLFLSQSGQPGEDSEALASALFDGLRFGIDGFERPEPEEDPDEDEIAAESQHATLRLLDGLSRTPLANQELWIAPTDAVGYSAELERKERDVKARGRRYRTDEKGRARITFRGRHQWVFARCGNVVVSDSVVLRAGEVKELNGYPPADLVVRVVDREGEPVRQVPVAILHRSRGDLRSELREVQRTRTRRGEARWDQVFGQIATWIGAPDDEYYVTFAFPMPDPPRVRIRADDDLSEPIVLTLPPTGELVVRLDPESVELDETARTYTHDPERKMYHPVVCIPGDPWGVEYEAVRGIRAREYRDEEDSIYFPFVGLGMELEARPWVYGYSSHRFTGPTAPEERVVVTLEPHRLVEASEPEPPPVGPVDPSIRASVLQLIDEDGRPVWDARCQFTAVVYTPGRTGEASWLSWERASDGSPELRHGGKSHLSLLLEGAPSVAGERATAKLLVRVRAEGYASLEAAEIDLDTRVTTFILSREEDHGIIRARLLLPPSALESLAGDPAYLSGRVAPVGEPHGDAGIVTTHLDAEGLVLSARALPPGRYRVHLEAWRSGQTLKPLPAELESMWSWKIHDVRARLEIELAPAQTLELGDIELHEGPPVFRGTIENADGSPLAAGTEVTVFRGGSWSKLRVAEDGLLHVLGPFSASRLEVEVRTADGLETSALLSRQ